MSEFAVFWEQVQYTNPAVQHDPREAARLAWNAALSLAKDKFFAIVDEAPT